MRANSPIMAHTWAASPRGCAGILNSTRTGRSLALTPVGIVDEKARRRSSGAKIMERSRNVGEARKSRNTGVVSSAL